LNPYELRQNELNYRILGTGTRTFGLGDTVELRKSVEVRAEAVSWNYAPVRPFGEGADDHLLSVDVEIGIILRLASHLGGEEYDVLEIAEIAFDEGFAEGTFRLELPGVAFEREDP
jgi:hypothetical protein